MTIAHYIKTNRKDRPSKKLIRMRFALQEKGHPYLSEALFFEKKISWNNHISVNSPERNNLSHAHSTHPPTGGFAQGTRLAFLASLVEAPARAETTHSGLKASGPERRASSELLRRTSRVAGEDPLRSRAEGFRNRTLVIGFGSPSGR